MIIHNAFSPHYPTEIVLKPETHEIRLHNAKTKAEREKLVLALAPNCTFKGKTETWANEERV